MATAGLGMTGATSTMLSNLQSSFSDSNVKSKISGLASGFLAKITEAKTDVSNKVSEILSNLSTNFTSSNIGSKIDGLKSAFTNAMNDAKNNVSTKASEIVSTLSTKFNAVNMGNVLGGIKSAFNTAITDAKRLVEVIATNIKTFINNLFGTQSNFTFSGLLNAFTNALSGPLKTLGEIITAINTINGTKISVDTSGITNTGGNNNSIVGNLLNSGNMGNTGNTGNKATTKPPTNNTSGGTASQGKNNMSYADIMAKIGRYASGGIPSVGSFFWAGEAGPEMLGTVGGKTTVASNGEITGISDTIRSTSSQEMSLMRQQNELLMAILNKPGLTSDELFNSVRTSANNYTNMTGNLAF